MSGPLHTLKHEHRVIERALRALQGVCIRLVWGDQVQADVLERLLEFISGYVDGFHHLKEETHLFSALQREGIAREGGVLGLIEQEHERERVLSEEMRAAIYDYKQIDPGARQHFVEAAARYSDLLLSHIEHEDSMLFRIAEELLENETKQALNEVFERCAAEFGADCIEAYEKMAGELEDSWAI